jgi:DNA-binding transcriptional regulator YhcF (GntR family)
MNAQNATPPKGQFSGARVVPLHIETARQLGGGARGRTLALIYRQLSYWSKYAKWTGSRGRKFFYKSQKELAAELGYSEKTINRAIKALKELGLVVVEKLHQRYWKQVSFYYLPHSPFAAAEPTPRAAEPLPPVSAPSSFSTTTKPSSLSAPAPGAGSAAAASAGVHPAAAATAASIRKGGGIGFSQNVRIQQKKDNPLIKQTLQPLVERCEAMRQRMIKMNQQEGGISLSPALL